MSIQKSVSDLVAKILASLIKIVEFSFSNIYVSYSLLKLSII
jgi:hypothetical protein